MFITRDLFSLNVTFCLLILQWVFYRAFPLCIFYLIVYLMFVLLLVIYVNIINTLIMIEVKALLSNIPKYLQFVVQ